MSEDAPVHSRPGEGAPAGEEVPSSEARARWNALLDRVQRQGGEIRITRYGQVVARLVPAQPPSERPSYLGCLAGSVVHQGDVVSPVAAAWSGWEDDPGSGA